MAVNDQTWKLINGLRIHVDSELDAALAEWVKGWAQAWTELSEEWHTLMMDVAAAHTAGTPVTAAKLLRTKRARAAIETAWTQIERLCDELDVHVERVLPGLVESAPQWQRDLWQSQLPAPTAPGMAVLLTRVRDVDSSGLSAIVERTTQQIHAQTRPLPEFVTRTMKGELVRGIALGDNPNVVARRTVQRVGDRFDLGRTRALVIARTEMLDAHRAAGQSWDLENDELMVGWQWLAKLDARTCPSCWSMHGRTFDTAVPGPLDHQQGRCARLPKAKPWRDLDLDADEPADEIPDAQLVFDALPEADQVAVMGRDRLRLLQTGQTSWDELALRRSTTGWRDSYAPTPVAKLAS